MALFTVLFVKKFVYSKLNGFKEASGKVVSLRKKTQNSRRHLNEY